MALKTFVYVSNSELGTDPAKVAQVVAHAARFNRMAGVTSVLLTDGQRFFHYLEGPDDGMDAVEARIRSATSHVSLRVLAGGRVTTRQVPYWPVQLLQIGTEDFTKLITADWSVIEHRSAQHTLPAEGMERLRSTIRRHVEMRPILQDF